MPRSPRTTRKRLRDSRVQSDPRGTPGERIRALRFAANLTQAALAARCHPPLGRAYVAHLECGHHEIGLNVLVRIADALEVSLDEIVGRHRRAA